MVVLKESGELESDEPIEESFFEELNCSYSSPPTTYSPPWGPTNFPYFPPSPTYFAVWGPTSFPSSPPSFPLYSPASPPPPPSSSNSSRLRVRTSVTYFNDFQNQQDFFDLTAVHFILFVDYIIQDRGGELNVINGFEGSALNMINQLEALNALGLEDVQLWLEERALNALDIELSLDEVNELEQQHEDIIDQLVIDFAGVDNSVIGYRGGELDVISSGKVFTINGVEYRQGQALSTTLEPSVVFQDKLSIRVWLGHRGQWAADIRYGWNWLNLGTFRTAEGAPLATESVKRLRGGKDLFDRPFLIENKLEPLQLPPTAQEENQDDGIGSDGTGDCAMADQAQFNSGYLEKRKTRENNPGGERRKKKANGVKIAIPLDDILQTKGMCLKAAANHLKVSISKLKSSCREYGILRWPPRNEHKLILQTLPKETPAVVDQMGISQLTSHTVPSNQALTATVDTNSGVEKEISLSQFLPTAQQGNFDAGFGNDEAEAIGVGVKGACEAVMEEAQLNSGGFGKDEAETIGVGIEGTREAVMEEAQLNLGCSKKKMKMKVNTPGGERGNNRTTGVRIAIPKEDILQTKGMRIEDASKHLEVSKSTLKRICRDYGIDRWPPRKEQELISQSRPNKSPAIVDQEQIPQLNYDMLLPSNQVPATSDTYSVKVKVRCEEGTIMFRLSCPWRKVELEQQVKERLLFEARTYKIEYKDEDDELILINCDKDLEECISSSSAGGSRWIELFLKVK